MSVVLDRSDLEQSPLADLHTLASDLDLDGYRRLRKAELIDAILDRQDGAAKPNGRRTRTTKSRTSSTKAKSDAPASSDDDAGDENGRPRRPRRGGRSRTRTDETAKSDDRPKSDDRSERTLEGVVEVLPNGSGFLRLTPPDATDNDVYVSAAQIKRCDLVAGDHVSGPVRAPRRSERFTSLVRVDKINGKSADDVTDRARFEDLPTAFPTERIALSSEDPTVKAIEWLTPIGKGSRVTIVGAERSGKSEALRRIAQGFGKATGVQLSVVLAGVRAEEIGDWSDGPATVAAALPLGSSAESQVQAIERAIDQGRRVTARGGDAVVLIDSLANVEEAIAQRLLASARKIADGGSLTIIATAPDVVGGETTVIALDAMLTGLRRFPALDLDRSGTMRPELLVGDIGADAIAKARAEALV